MENATDLFDKLNQCAAGAPEWQELYDDFTNRLNTLSVGKSAPAVGEAFPSISLPDPSGSYCNIADLYADGPLVVSFNRGSWCPYCTHELESWHDNLAALHAAGGRLVAIAGEIGGRADSLVTILGGKADVLCDVDHGAALGLGLAFHAGEDLLRRYLECGLDLSDIYGSHSGILPIPATFVVDRGGIIRYAFVDPDFRLRAEPRDVIAIVSELGD